MSVQPVLVLSKADNLNWRALCAFLQGRHVRRTIDRRRDDMIPQGRKLRMLQDQDYRCADCGHEFIVRNGRCPEATVEHVIKFQYGGESNRHNTILVCDPCNKRRDDEYSLEMIEAHYGQIDMTLVDYVPVVRFDTPGKSRKMFERHLINEVMHG